MTYLKMVDPENKQRRGETRYLVLKHIARYARRGWYAYTCGTSAKCLAERAYTMLGTDRSWLRGG